MTIIPHNQRFLPHEVITRFYACKLYSQHNVSVAFVTRRYKISKASLMRWMKRFDGTKDSLVDTSHRPHSVHPNSHTPQEIQWINNYLRRNPTITMIELYGKLRIQRGYSRHPSSLFRFLRKQGYYKESLKPKKTYQPKPYDTPKMIGIKWQCDVKYVPKNCKASSLLGDQKFYQYTMIDEASRERFIYHYDEHSSYSSQDFVKRCLMYYGYRPKIIQTDNGFEFTHTTVTDREHPFDILLRQLNITHQLIRPRTPRHNGKVERSHRNDNKRFYRTLKFYSLNDLRLQAKRYLQRSNQTPMSTLGYFTPLETREKLIRQYNNHYTG
jgi:transposase InsO family protein